MDREMWNLAVFAVTEAFSRVARHRRDLVDVIAQRVKACKQEMHAVVEAVAAAGICASCGGECCRTGKYHFTVADLLVYLVDDRALFTPRFDQDACPYLGDRGCLMAPGYRPFNCITFTCERLERLVGPQEKDRCVRLEQELRDHYRRIEELFDPCFRGGLLMSWERNSTRKRSAIQ
jgi:hypothetical protein